MFTRNIYIALLNCPNGESKAFYGNRDQALAYYNDFIQDCKDCERFGASVALQKATSTISEYGITSILSVDSTECLWRCERREYPVMIQMPKLPTAEEIRNMPDSKYEAYHTYLLNLCYQAIGASYAVVSDSADIRKKYPEVREYLDNLHDYYSKLIDQLQEALDWMFKVRYAIK